MNMSNTSQVTKLGLLVLMGMLMCACSVKQGSQASSESMPSVEESSSSVQALSAGKPLPLLVGRIPLSVLERHLINSGHLLHPSGLQGEILIPTQPRDLRHLGDLLVQSGYRLGNDRIYTASATHPAEVSSGMGDALFVHPARPQLLVTVRFVAGSLGATGDTEEAKLGIDVTGRLYTLRFLAVEGNQTRFSSTEQRSYFDRVTFEGGNNSTVESRRQDVTAGIIVEYLGGTVAGDWIRSSGLLNVSTFLGGLDRADVSVQIQAESNAGTWTTVALLDSADARIAASLKPLGLNLSGAVRTIRVELKVETVESIPAMSGSAYRDEEGQNSVRADRPGVAPAGVLPPPPVPFDPALLGESGLRRLDSVHPPGSPGGASKAGNSGVGTQDDANTAGMGQSSGVGAVSEVSREAVQEPKRDLDP